MVTLVGEVTVQRPYTYHHRCKSRAIPLDEQLGLGASSLSGGVEEAVRLVCAHLSFEEAVHLLERVGLVRVSRQTAQKVAESVGEQIVRAQQAQREAAWAGQRPEPPKRVPKRR